MHPAYRLNTPEDPKDGDSPSPIPFGRSPAQKEDLPYKVELWTTDRSSVEQTLAITASPTIGYAAYFAASREFPDRLITLRHKNEILNRSSAPPSH